MPSDSTKTWSKGCFSNAFHEIWMCSNNSGVSKFFAKKYLCSWKKTSEEVLDFFLNTSNIENNLIFFAKKSNQDYKIDSICIISTNN